MGQRICSVEGCSTPVGDKGARGFCSRHYKKWRRYGDPTTVVVMRGASVAERFWSRVDTSGECWPWKGHISKDGYGSYNTGEPGTLRTHRIAWELTHGPIPDGLHVLHRCDNPPCCNPAHLWLGTDAENKADKMAKNRQRAPQKKLTRDQGVAIRERYAAGGVSLRELARHYDVTYTAIRNIVLGRVHR